MNTHAATYHDYQYIRHVLRMKALGVKPLSEDGFHKLLDVMRRLGW